MKYYNTKQSKRVSVSGKESGAAIYNRVVRNILDRERRFRMRFLVGGMELLSIEKSRVRIYIL